MKKAYQNPFIELNAFESADVITTSGTVQANLKIMSSGFGEKISIDDGLWH